jgi:enterochelin esterase-like enzyme
MEKEYFFKSLGAIILLSLISCKVLKENMEKPLSESRIKIDTIFSTNLEESRLISTYLPKGYTKEKTYPVIYATDGQIVVDSYKQSVDSIIENKIIPEFIFVGVHSNETNVPNSGFSYRNYEYVKGWADEKDTLLNARFYKHYDFFTKEVLNFIQQKYSVTKEKKNRFFYGVSNGAGFGVTLGSENPNLFSIYICFSMAGGNYENLKWTNYNSPYYYLAYGNEEPYPLVIALEEFDQFLTQNNHDHSLHIYDGGHDRKKWESEFLNILSKIIKR